MGMFRYTWRSFVREIGVLVAVIAFFLPLYILVVVALKPGSDIYLAPLALPSDPQWSNFSSAWEGSGTTTIARSLVNNLIITIGSVGLTIVIGGLCAYTLARRSSKLSTVLYMLFVIGLIMPFQIGIVPLYILFREFNLIGSYLGIIILHAGLFMPLTVFLYAGFIRALPREYEEAARVDGATLPRILFRVVLPLLGPITGTIAILLSVFTWNEFFLSLIFLSGTPNQPLSVAIYAFVGEFSAEWNFIFAVVLISIAPIMLFYLFAQKQLIKGFAGGIRG